MAHDPPPLTRLTRSNRTSSASASISPVRSGSSIGRTGATIPTRGAILNPLVEAAAAYLSRGLPVIALTGKTPNVTVHRRGLTAPFVASDTLVAGKGSVLYTAVTAFEHPHTTGIGIVIPYPYVVVDIDGEVGAENWKALVGDSFMPDRWVAKTGRGLHLWYSSVEPTGSMKLGELLDLKGQSSYVAAPPSRHPDGHLYEWLLTPDSDAPMEAPDALLERIHRHNFEREGILIRKRQQKRIRHQPFEGGRLWASIGFDHLIDGMGTAGPGNRNNYLHWAAATMAEEGALDEEFDALKAAALEAGLTNLETRRTIRSARSERA